LNQFKCGSVEWGVRHEFGRGAMLVGVEAYAMIIATRSAINYGP